MGRLGEWGWAGLSFPSFPFLFFFPASRSCPFLSFPSFSLGVWSLEEVWEKYSGIEGIRSRRRIIDLYIHIRMCIVMYSHTYGWRAIHFSKSFGTLARQTRKRPRWAEAANIVVQNSSLIPRELPTYMNFIRSYRSCCA